MNTQVNVRMPIVLYKQAQKHAKKKGYGSIQEFIRETVREEVFDDELTEQELNIVRKVIKEADKNNSWGTREDLMNALNGK